ncbi:MAG: T9SS type A sorting domain-containing protein, partial [Flavobacteriales bacterium]
VAYNTVKSIGSSTWSSAVSITDCADVRCVNNIFAHFAGKPAFSISPANTSLYNLNNNCYYTTGSTLGNWGVTTVSLLSFQTLTGYDTNSIDYDPQFLSSSNLHLSITSPAIARGTAMASVLTDHDGDVRDSDPDIGADEVPGGVINSMSKKDVNDRAEIMIYPNPAHDLITFYFNSISENETADIRITDIYGREVFSSTITHLQMIPVGFLETGYYIVCGRNFVLRFVKE